ncbi:MAG: hypothetical protein ACP5GZ_10920 [Vulcanisaeta sp.]|uniref:hypothetical protein n=1 Tax=Vulcanisaeta sp. TaxID=2020871 RepID=UPI003D0BEA4F
MLKQLAGAILRIHKPLIMAILVIIIVSMLISINYVFADVGYVCWKGPMVAEGMLWTPIALLNSPYNGYASAQGAYTATYIFSSGPLILTSQVSSQSFMIIYANNGSAVGLFRLDKWAIYSTKMVPVIGGWYEPCAQPYVAQDLGPVLVDNAQYFAEIAILPPGTISDENEPHQIFATITNKTGYYSVIFNNGFSNSSIIDIRYMCDAPSQISHYTVNYYIKSPILLITNITISINGYVSNGLVMIWTSYTKIVLNYTLLPGYVYVISRAGGQGPAYAFEAKPCQDK